MTETLCPNNCLHSLHLYLVWFNPELMALQFTDLYDSIKSTINLDPKELGSNWDCNANRKWYRIA